MPDRPPAPATRCCRGGQTASRLPDRIRARAIASRQECRRRRRFQSGAGPSGAEAVEATRLIIIELKANHMDPQTDLAPKHPAWEPGKTRSLPEVHGTVPIPLTGGFWKKMLAFAGPGYLVAVGYMDPGNWATDLQGGARYGYTLLSVIVISNLMAIL